MPCAISWPDSKNETLKYNNVPSSGSSPSRYQEVPQTLSPLVELVWMLSSACTPLLLNRTRSIYHMILYYLRCLVVLVVQLPPNTMRSGLVWVGVFGGLLSRLSEPEDASRHTARDPPPRGGAALPPTHHVVIVRVSVASGFARGIRLCFVSDVLQPQASSACRSSLRWTQHCCSLKGKCSSTKCSAQQNAKY